MSDFDFSKFSASLEEPLDAQPQSSSSAAPASHPCVYCGGDGQFLFISSGHVGTCHACNGKGRMPMNAQDQRTRRAKNKERAAKGRQTRMTNMQAAQNTNRALDVFAEVENMTSWNSFATSLMEQHAAGRAWTENQINAVRRMIAKTEATRKRTRGQFEERAKASTSPKLKALVTAMMTVKMQRPVLRVSGLNISRAPDHGKNGGFLYVKQGSEYKGKISPEGQYMGSDAADLVPALEAISADPAEAARRHGRETGQCSCCGRTLTDPASIEAGIGPVCATRWSF